MRLFFYFLYILVLKDEFQSRQKETLGLRAPDPRQGVNIRMKRTCDD